MSWIVYLKACVEVIICLSIFSLLVYLYYRYKDNNLKIPLIIGFICILAFLIVDSLILRGTIFKINEGLDNVSSDNTSSNVLPNSNRSDLDYQKLSKGYLTGETLNIREIDGVENISGGAFIEFMEKLYPIGTILFMDKNPKESLKFGEWELLSKNKNFSDVRCLMVSATGPTDKYPEKGGLANIPLTQNQIPYHDHTLFLTSNSDNEDKHKTFKLGPNANYKMNLDSISRQEAEKYGTNCKDPECVKTGTASDKKMQALVDEKYFKYDIPHNNISPFIALNVWVRTK